MPFSKEGNASKPNNSWLTRKTPGGAEELAGLDVGLFVGGRDVGTRVGDFVVGLEVGVGKRPSLAGTPFS